SADLAFEASYGAGLFEAAVSLPVGDTLLLQLFLTPPGEELRLVTRLTRDPQVLAASLNYVGDSAARDEGEDRDAVTRLDDAWQGCLIPPNREIRGFGRPTLSKILRETTRPVVAVVDPDRAHCEAVMHTVLAGFESVAQRDSPIIIGAALPVDG